MNKKRYTLRNGLYLSVNQILHDQNFGDKSQADTENRLCWAIKPGRLLDMWVWVGLVVLLWSLSGCSDKERITVEVGQVQATVELASTPEERRQGLMGRTVLGRDQGMLMVFPSPAIVKFWMRNTSIPLDIGFFDAQRKLINTASMLPDGGKQTYSPTRPSVYALEMNMGWFERHGLEPGVKMRLPYPIEGR